MNFCYLLIFAKIRAQLEKPQFIYGLPKFSANCSTLSTQRVVVAVPGSSRPATAST